MDWVPIAGLLHFTMQRTYTLCPQIGDFVPIMFYTGTGYDQKNQVMQRTASSRFWLKMFLKFLTNRLCICDRHYDVWIFNHILKF